MDLTLSTRQVPSSFIIRSPSMQMLMARIGKFARSNKPLLILGETGTGKGAVAREVHRLSPRRGNHYRSVNCTTLTEQLLTSELFGHEKGSFTGADCRHIGLFEQATGGTLLLDEIGDASKDLQPKLLQVIEDRIFRRVGGRDDIQTDVRVVAATHRDLPVLVKSGDFRQDLYFRLNVLPIHIPPLRDRPEDLLVIADKCCEGASCRLSEGARKSLLGYHWPGNIRELQNVLDRACLIASLDYEDGCQPPTIEIQPEHIQLESQLSTDEDRPNSAWIAEQKLMLSVSVPLVPEGDLRRRLLTACDREVIGLALRNCKSGSASAEFLGISRSLLAKKIRELV
jgi:two-component system nitrogen regulation response regulator GlnG